jgi:hypothetical protein
MKAISRLTLVLAVGLVLAASVQAVSANCPNSRAIFTYGTYITAPAGHVGASATFWAVGTGNPTNGSGRDAGSYVVGNWFKAFSATQYFLAGDWAICNDLVNDCVDGCVDDNPPATIQTAVAAWAQDAPAGLATKGYFAVLCTSGVWGAGADYDYTSALGVDTPMVEIPKPTFVSPPTRNVNVDVTVDVAAPALSGGVYTDSCNASTLVRGWKLYTQKANTAPGDRTRTVGWGQEAGHTAEIPILNSTGSITIPCGGNTQVFLGRSLVFDSGFETGIVGQSTAVSCSGTLSTRPDDDNFRQIRKPRTRLQK